MQRRLAQSAGSPENGGSKRDQSWRVFPVELYIVLATTGVDP